jgi:hypothetical protein
MLVAAALPSTAQSAGRSVLVGVGGGGTFPTGDFGADTKSGYNFGAFVQYRAPDAIVGLRGELQYHRNDMKESLLFDLQAPPGTTGYWRTLYAGLAGVMEAMPRDARVGWFIVAGGGLYTVTPTVSEGGIEVSDSESKPGFNAGAGLRFRIGAASIYMEARYHGLKIDDAHFTFLPVTFGIAF